MPGRAAAPAHGPPLPISTISTVPHFHHSPFPPFPISTIPHFPLQALAVPRQVLAGRKSGIMLPKRGTNTAMATGDECPAAAFPPHFGSDPKSALQGFKSRVDAHGIGVALAVLERLVWTIFSNRNDARFCFQAEADPSSLCTSFVPPFVSCPLVTLSCGSCDPVGDGCPNSPAVPRGVRVTPCPPAQSAPSRRAEAFLCSKLPCFGIFPLGRA